MYQVDLLAFPFQFSAHAASRYAPLIFPYLLQVHLYKLSIIMKPRMYYDDAAWEKSEEMSEAWIAQFTDLDILRKLGRFLVRHHEPDKPDSFDFLEKGAFNISFEMTYKNTSSAIIRLPQLVPLCFPKRKSAMRSL